MIENIVFKSDDNYISSIYEDCMLQYDLYLAESSAFNTLNAIDTDYIQESGDIEIINESIKETLTLWIGKFTEAVQRALNKFVAVIEGQQDLAYLKSIEGRVKVLNQDPGFTVTNIRNYDSMKIQEFRVVPFMDVYNANKDSLQSKDQFLIQNYRNYGFTEGNTNIQDVMQASFVKVEPKPVDITIENIRGYYDWCRNGYTQDLKPIQDQMNTYNNSIKSISNLVANLPDDYKSPEANNNPDVTPKNNSQPLLAPPTESFMLASKLFLTEDVAGQPGQVTTAVGSVGGTTPGQKAESNPGKMTFDNKVNYVAQAAGGNQEAVNAVKTYLTCTTTILSSMMKIVKNRKADYLRVLKHLFPVNREMRAVAASPVNVNRINQVDTSRLSAAEEQ